MIASRVAGPAQVEEMCGRVDCPGPVGVTFGKRMGYLKLSRLQNLLR